MTPWYPARVSRRLQIGCGARGRPDWVDLDRALLPGVDLVADLDRPLPFADGIFDEVLAEHVLEHVADLVALLGELARVCRPGARLHVVVPHFSSVGAFTDPTHRRFFGYHSFDNFTADGDYNFYSRTRLRIDARRIRYFWVKNRRRVVPSRFLTWLINLWPLAYERFFCWWLPASEVAFELTLVAPEARP